MNHYYPDVPGLGNIAFSRHAQDRLIADGVSEDTVRQILYHCTKPDVSDGRDVIWREDQGIRLVILTNPTPNRGAKLVKTAYRVQGQLRTRY